MLMFYNGNKGKEYLKIEIEVLRTDTKLSLLDSSNAEPSKNYLN